MQDSKRRGRAGKQTFYDRMVALFGTGVLFVEEAKWHARREYLQPAFSLTNIRQAGGGGGV